MSGQSAGAPSGGIPPRAVIAVIIGNWLEFYDFIIYTFFTVMIAKAFFPASNDFVGLLLSTAVFWAGFFTRPLGAAVIGAYADRAGRKAAMTLTIMLMALGTGMLALTPSYADIGIAAPIIVLIARLIQGFSCGGEVGPATTYLLEAAPPNQRAALTSWQGTSQQFAGVMGSAFGLALAALLPEEDLYEWGWRVPFLVGLLIGPVGLYIRRVLPETMDKHEAHESSMAVLGALFRHHSMPVLLAILCIVGPTISTYVSGYMTTYAITTLKLPTDVAMLATMCGYIVSIAGIPLGAWVADRIGPKISIIVPRLFFILVVYQAYVAMTAAGSSLETLLVVNMGLNFLLALANGGLYAVITQAFPKAVRSSGLSIAYAISVTVFGGSTQLIITWLIATLGDPLVPAWYQIGANILSILALLLIVNAKEKTPPAGGETPA